MFFILLMDLQIDNQIEDELHYQKKYLKYKSKYLALKEEYEGGRVLKHNEIIDALKTELVEMSKNPGLSKYFKLTDEDKKKKTMYDKYIKKNNNPSPTIEKIHKIIDDEYQSTKEGNNIDNGYKLSNGRSGFNRFLNNVLQKADQYLNKREELVNYLYNKLKYRLFFESFSENEQLKFTPEEAKNLFEEDLKKVVDLKKKHNENIKNKKK
jgi:hypothetical protein